MGVDLRAEPGQEIWRCLVTKLPEWEGFRAVNRVASLQTDGVHHMNVMALALSGVSLERGMHDCRDLYTGHPELMENGVYIYASQVAESEILLPQGVAAMIPGGIDIMVEMHFINTTEEPVDVFSRINAYWMDGEVADSIWGHTVRDVAIDIPARSKTIEKTRCVMSEDVNVLFMASHTHELADLVTIHRFDGTSAGDEVYRNTDWHAPSLLSFGDGMAVPKGTGFELECHFDNPRDEAVRWGFGAKDEMCQFTLVFTPGDSSVECTIVP